MGCEEGARREGEGVGGPSIGKFKGGTLSLSEKDVRSITGGGGVRRARGRKGRDELRQAGRST